MKARYFVKTYSPASDRMVPIIVDMIKQRIELLREDDPRAYKCLKSKITFDGFEPWSGFLSRDLNFRRAK